MKQYEYLGKTITAEELVTESTGYGDVTMSRISTWYRVGKDFYDSLNNAKVAIFKKTPAGKKLLAKKAALIKKERVLEIKSRQINEQIRYLNQKIEKEALKR